jgi:hypothetical protein
MLVPIPTVRSETDPHVSGRGILNPRQFHALDPEPILGMFSPVRIGTAGNR